MKKYLTDLSIKILFGDIEKMKPAARELVEELTVFAYICGILIGLGISLVISAVAMYLI